MALINTAKEARNLIYDLIEANKSSLGVGFVGVDDEQRLPYYPAVVCSAGPVERTLGATHTFDLGLRVFIWVYHAELAIGHRARSDKDLDLADAIIDLVEQDMTFGDKVIHGFVETQAPGLFQPRNQEGGALIIGTRMTWAALSQKRW